MIISGYQLKIERFNVIGNRLYHVKDLVIWNQCYLPGDQTIARMKPSFEMITMLAPISVSKVDLKNDINKSKL